MNHLTNRRRSDGTPLDGRHGISELCDGSSWRCITKRDRLNWLGLTRFCTTVRVSKQEQVMFESSSKSRKSWNGWQMTWQWVPDIWSNRWKRFGGCDGGFTWGNKYRQNWSRAECSRRYIFWDERCQIGWLLKLEYPESNRSDFKANSVANRKPMQIRKNRCNVAEPRFLCNHSSEGILNMLKASEIWNGCASQERVAIIKSRDNYSDHRLIIFCVDRGGWERKDCFHEMKLWSSVTPGGSISRSQKCSSRRVITWSSDLPPAPMCWIRHSLLTIGICNVCRGNRIILVFNKECVPGGRRSKVKFTRT